jgi:hypothetical protein
MTLDFEKAFDKVEHQLMLEIMKEKEFPDQWLNWMQQIFNSRTSAVLLNSVPGKVFHYLRGGKTRRPTFFSVVCPGCRFSTDPAECSLLK